MTYKSHLIITTLLPSQGRCGVQTHFNTIERFAVSLGMMVSIVTPYDNDLWLQRFSRVIGRFIKRVNRGWAVFWSREFSAILLKKQLARILYSSPDIPIVIYAQDPLSACIANEFRKKNSKLRVVLVVHYNISEAHEHKLLGNTIKNGFLWRHLFEVEKKAIKHVDTVIFVSNFMRNSILDRLPEASSINQYVIHNFPLIPSEDNHPDLNIRGDLLAIGTLEKRKNQSYLLHVLAEAKRKGYRYSLTIVGDGPDDGYLQKVALDLGINDQIKFLGFRPYASRFLLTHRVLVHSALIESFGIVFTEALYFGRPSITTEVGGIPEIITNGVEGIYWPLNDADRGSDLLIKLLEDPVAYEKMCAAARRRYEKNYKSEILGRTWIHALIGLI